MSYRVVVFDNYEGFRAWQVWPTDGSDPLAATRAKIVETGDVPIYFHPDGTSFTWLCPGCRSYLGGTLGDVPVSGWDSPCWVLSGEPGKPTLTPSLGCGGWRNGICPEGHYWLRDGELVPA